MEGICQWDSKSKRAWHGASLDFTWKTRCGKVAKARIFGHEQWGRVWSITGRNVYGSEDGGKLATIFSDSRLVVGQVKGKLEARDVRMQGYLIWINHLQKKFESFDLQHIPIGGNTHIDSLATLATFLTQNLPRVILVEDLGKPLGEKGNMIYVPHVRVGPS